MLQYLRQVMCVMVMATFALGMVAEKSFAHKGEHKMVECHGECVVIKTNLGSFTVKLDPEKAPKTVENFKRYVQEGFYKDTIFHRVIHDFMIQGGGMDLDLSPKSTHDSIPNESDNGLKNSRGTIAMARTSDPDSATAQFFINVKNNDHFLDHKNGKAGYAVFGHVIEGMNVVDAIAATRTATKNGYSDVPIEPIVIESTKMK